MEPNSNQLTQRLSLIYRLLDSPVLTQEVPETADWQTAFTQLISEVDALLSQARQAGKPVVFYETVGSHGKIQDISMLVTYFWNTLENSTTAVAVPNHRLHRYFGRGTGMFADGTFFTGEYNNEVAFFLNDYRIYLNQHIRRAVEEAEHNLSTPDEPIHLPEPTKRVPDKAGYPQDSKPGAATSTPQPGRL